MYKGRYLHRWDGLIFQTRSKKIFVRNGPHDAFMFFATNLFVSVSWREDSAGHPKFEICKDFTYPGHRNLKSGRLNVKKNIWGKSTKGTSAPL
jgi:hypothetical protein